MGESGRCGIVVGDVVVDLIARIGELNGVERGRVLAAVT